MIVHQGGQRTNGSLLLGPWAMMTIMFFVYLAGFGPAVRLVQRGAARRRRQKSVDF